MASKKNKGFSLVELLVTAGIIGALLFFGVKAYNDKKKKTHITWAKAEMSHVFQFMKSAKANDGYYHQYIYAAGYQPKGKVYASVGTDGAAGTICCNKYPNPGTSPCVKNKRSGFLYYNCGNTALDKATDNIEICNDTTYKKSASCDIQSGLSALKTSDFSNCAPGLKTWCNCFQISVGAVTSFGGKKMELNLDSLGNLCSYEQP